MLVAINARQRGNDVVRRVRLQRSMFARDKRAVAFQEVQQIRNLLQIGGDIRVVARKVDVIELNINNMFDLAAGGVQIAVRLFPGAGCGIGGRGLAATVSGKSSVAGLRANVSATITANARLIRSDS